MEEDQPEVESDLQGEEIQAEDENPPYMEGVGEICSGKRSKTILPDNGDTDARMYERKDRSGKKFISYRVVGHPMKYVRDLVVKDKKNVG